MTIRTLEIDIETKPARAWVWGLWDQNISLAQVDRDPEIMSFAYRWTGEREVFFVAEWTAGRRHLIQTLRDLVDEADIVVGWNSQRFDVPWVIGEIIKEGLPAPSPVVHFDLMRAYKKHARFLSFKLDYVAETLLGGGKVKHEGFDLWLKCMNGDPAAQRRMERYNKKDVRLLGPLAKKIRPYANLPINASLADGTRVGCPACGSPSVQRRGFAFTTTGKYPRYVCQKCGKWSRGNRSEQGTQLRNIPR